MNVGEAAQLAEFDDMDELGGCENLSMSRKVK